MNTADKEINDQIDLIIESWFENVILNDDEDLKVKQALDNIILLDDNRVPIKITGLPRNLAAGAVAGEQQAKGPGVFCISDDQCAVARLQQRAGDVSARCNGLGLNANERNGAMSVIVLLLPSL